MKNKKANACLHLKNNYSLLKCKQAAHISNQLIINKIIPDSKCSQGHVEMILSFILFISAILFIFFYINPFSKTTDKSNELEHIQKIIMENISVKAGRLSVVSYSGGCYNFSLTEYPPINYVEFPEISPGSYKKYTVYFSDNFLNINAPNKDVNCLSNNYRLGVYSNETIILYDLLKNIATNSNTNAGYKDTKKNLGINMDFVINSTDLNKNFLPELSFSKRIPSTVEVQSKEFPIRLVKNDGTIIDAIFNLRVW